MNLQKHLRRQASNRLWHTDHGAADDVGGCALNGRVDGGTLGKACAGAFGSNLGCVDFAAKKRLYITVTFCKLGRFIHIGADTWKAFEVTVDEALRFAARDAQIAREAEARDAIDHTEVDRFGASADIGGHVFKRYIKDFRGGHRVNIVAVFKGLLQSVDSCDMREDAQLDL